MRVKRDKMGTGLLLCGIIVRGVTCVELIFEVCLPRAWIRGINVRGFNSGSGKEVIFNRLYGMYFFAFCL